MLFNSRIFIFAFFPILLLVYYGLHRLKLHKVALCSLILASFIFYGYNHPSYLLLLIGSVIFNYHSYIFMNKLVDKKPIRKLVAIFAVVANIAVLFYFKYFDFFLQNCNKLIGTDFVLRNIMLPLGISFFTFQQISFVIDAYNGEIKDYNFIEYTLFVSFFPQLVAGPIVLHDELIPQFGDKSRYKINGDRFLDGIRYFIIGLSKKTLLADNLARVADAGFIDNMGWDTYSTIFIALCYMFQLYFDFSGYSDMAMGLGKMLGFDLPINFDSPLKTKNQGAMWQQWHITLFRFLKKYIYIPLGGSRKGVFRTYINIMLLFTISGIWHGAGWTYIAWGVLTGIGSISYRLCRKWYDKLPDFISLPFNFAYTVFVCIFFRSAYVSQATSLLKCLGNIHWNGSMYELTNKIIDGCSDFTGLVISLVFFIIVAIIVFLMPSSHQMAKKKNGYLGLIGYGTLLAMCILTFANVSTFIYFNF